jgi:peptidoglycan/xylan/chitin deacetylase (PgdA/CDA1 family)
MQTRDFFRPPGGSTDWFAAPLRRRLGLRVLIGLPEACLSALALGGERLQVLSTEARRWRRARRSAGPGDWRRRTRSSYVVLYYHRLAGELKPGQERLDLDPALFTRQMRLLARLRFHALSPAEVRGFHSGALAQLPRRSYVVTADDGFRDCVAPFTAQAGRHPWLFVSTGEVGGRSWWVGNEPLADWPELTGLAAAGVEIGSHSTSHHPLDELSDEQLRETLARSRAQLRDRLGSEEPALAYPHGRRDGRVLAAARESGFALAFTTDPGRNGMATDPLELRRVGVKAWDNRASFLFKVLTGELLPAGWEQRRLRRALPAYHRLQSSRHQSATAPPGRRGRGTWRRPAP